MPKVLWALVGLALVLAASIALSSEKSAAALLIHKSAIITAIAVPIAWVVYDVVTRVWQAWRRAMSRPYFFK
jgi:hypothetical protein